MQRATPRDARPADLEVEHDGLGRDDAGGVEGHLPGYGTGGHGDRRRRGQLVDIDRFIATNQASWARLEQLTATAGERARLGPAEVDELVQLYQRASTHLSHARTQRADPALVARLTGWWPTPAACSTAPGRARWPAFARFFTTSFPAAVWHARRFVVAQRAPAVRAGGPDGRVARALRRRARGVGARRRARGLRRGGLRGVLLVGARRASSPPRSR